MCVCVCGKPRVEFCSISQAITWFTHLAWLFPQTTCFKGFNFEIFAAYFHAMPRIYTSGRSKYIDMKWKMIQTLHNDIVRCSKQRTATRIDTEIRNEHLSSACDNNRNIYKCDLNISNYFHQIQTIFAMIGSTLEFTRIIVTVTRRAHDIYVILWVKPIVAPTSISYQIISDILAIDCNWNVCLWPVLLDFLSISSFFHQCNMNDLTRTRDTGIHLVRYFALIKITNVRVRKN